VIFTILYGLKVIAERLSEEEIGGLKELFKMIDADNSGTITFDELKEGLKRVGSDLMESEIKDLMDASFNLLSVLFCLQYLVLMYDLARGYRQTLITVGHLTMVNSLLLRFT